MIIVCSLADQKSICQSVNASHLISVVDPGYQPETPHNIQNHLKLGFDDIIEIKEENTEILQRFSTYAQLMEKDLDELAKLSKELRAELDLFTQASTMSKPKT